MMEKLEEIRKRLNKATLGPWTVGDGSEDAFWEGKNCVVHKKDRVIVSRPLYGRPARFDRQTCADIRLIAHAPDDIKYLLEQTTTMQEENERLKANSMIQEHIISNGNDPIRDDKIVRLIMDNSALKSENATFKKALDMMADAIVVILSKPFDGKKLTDERLRLITRFMQQARSAINSKEGKRNEQ